MPDISIHVQAENKGRQSVHAPSDMNTQEFLNELLEGFDLLRNNGGGSRLNYRLEDRQTGRVLDLEKTLEENDVRGGETLLLHAQQPATVTCRHCHFANPIGGKFCRSCGKPLSAVKLAGDVKIHVHFQDGTSRPVEAPGDFRVRELTAELVGAPQPSDAPPEWTLHDKETGRNLDPDKTLIENGVASGHHLYLRKRLPQPIDGKPIPPRPIETWKILAAAAILVILTGGGILLYKAVANPLEVSPKAVSLSVSERQQFTANSRGKRQPVTWILSPELGTITPEGVYTAPRLIKSSQKVTITARSLEHPGTSAKAEVTLRPSEFSVVVAPETATLIAGETVKFGSIVGGSSNTDVRWALEPAVGSISQDGLYRAPSPIPSEMTVTVTGRSEADPSKFGSAILTLKPVTISLSPGYGSLKAAERLRFTAVIGGTANHAALWSTRGPGEISKNGVYFAPQTISQAQAVGIVATSIADRTKSAIAQVKLVPVVNIDLGPSQISLSAGQHAQFTASVSGTMNPAVRWSFAGPGTLSQNGEYAAPTSIPAEQEVRVTATSAADSSKSATATITLRPITVSLTPAHAELWASQSRKFSASVVGTPNAAVRWSLAGRGTLSEEGVFLAPSAIRADEVARVTATSIVDPARSATAIVMLKRYAGPMTGTLIWSGQVEKNGSITIDDAGASRGLLNGQMLPGMPVQISIDNNREFALETAPGPSNGWKRLTIRSKRGKAATVRITWLVAMQ